MDAIIIENEKDARELLSGLIQKYVPEINIIGEAGSAREGIQLIRELKPDLLFLDIDLGDATGFDVLDSTSGYDYKIIFTTAYDNYAIKAFNYNTIQYLLKPYGIGDIKEAINKVKSNLDNGNHQKNIESLLKEYYGERSKKVAFPTSDGVWVLDPNEVIRLEGEGSYTYLYAEERKKILLSKSLGEIEESLPANKFFRIHRSHLVNIDFIERYVKDEGGYIILVDKTQLPLSRYKKEDFLSFITGKS